MSERFKHRTSERNVRAVTRRDFTKAGLAAAIAGFLKTPASEAAPGYDDAPLSVGDERFFDELLHDQKKLQQFRDNPQLDDIYKLLRTLAKVNLDWTRDIERKAHAMHAGACELYTKEGRFHGNATILRIHDERVTGGPPAYRYVLVTAAHVARDVPVPANALNKSWFYHPHSGDVAVCEVSEGSVPMRGSRRDALHLGISTKRSTRDISGLFGIGIGRDNDTGSLERKVYPSLISPRVSRRFFQAIGSNGAGLVQLDEQRLVILHPKEINKVNGLYAAQGMSGSAFLVYDEGQQGVEFGGIFIAVGGIGVPDPANMQQGRMYTVGQIADHITVREAISGLFNQR